MKLFNIFRVVTISTLFACCHSIESVWNVNLTQDAKKPLASFFVIPNYMYAGSYVWVQINCEAAGLTSADVEVEWLLQEVDCMENMLKVITQKQNSVLMASTQQLQLNQTQNFTDANMKHAVPVNFQASPPTRYSCGTQNTVIQLTDESAKPYYIAHLLRSALSTNGSVDGVPVHLQKQERSQPVPPNSNMNHRVVDAWGDGMYHFLLKVVSVDGAAIKVNAYIKMTGEYGYLPAISWPYMTLSGVMGLVYLTIGTVWLCVWGCAHLHSTKIHLVIGGIIIAGALSNTLSFTDLTFTNSTGTRLAGIYWLCEMVSALQMAATYLMLMFVATGYGISRPKLSRTLIVFPMVICFLEFFAIIAVQLTNDEHLKIKYMYPALSKMSYALEGVFMIIILGWIMVYSIMTFLHLYRRRHSDEKMFTAFCIFMASCVVAFIAGGVMLLLLQGFFTACRSNWKGEWMTQGAQQVLLCLLLTVQMWLWRPVDEAQSYGFQPLVDSGDKQLFDDDDEDDDEEDVILEVTRSSGGHTENIKLISVKSDGLPPIS